MIEAMDRETLLATWDKLFGQSAPKHVSQPFLRRYLAFELQARARGGLPKRFAAELEKAAKQDRRHGIPNTLKPGARLIREWNGMTHVVDVVDHGFLWNGQHYRSLSPIARAITGARWSGPRFFSLKRPA